MLGTDSHKRSHTLVATDDNGRELAHRTIKATPAGHLEGLRWARRWPQRTWALEDCRHLSRRAVRERIAGHDNVVAGIARELVADICQLTVRINALERRIATLVAPLAPTLLEEAA